MPPARLVPAEKELPQRKLGFLRVEGLDVIGGDAQFDACGVRRVL